MVGSIFSFFIVVDGDFFLFPYRREVKKGIPIEGVSFILPMLLLCVFIESISHFEQIYHDLDHLYTMGCFAGSAQYRYRESYRRSASGDRLSARGVSSFQPPLTGVMSRFIPFGEEKTEGACELPSVHFQAGRQLLNRTIGNGLGCFGRFCLSFVAVGGVSGGLVATAVQKLYIQVQCGGPRPGCDQVGMRSGCHQAWSRGFVWSNHYLRKTNHVFLGECSYRLVQA